MKLIKQFPIKNNGFRLRPPKMAVRKLIYIQGSFTRIICFPFQVFFFFLLGAANILDKLLRGLNFIFIHHGKLLYWLKGATPLRAR